MKKTKYEVDKEKPRAPETGAGNMRQLTVTHFLLKKWTIDDKRAMELHFAI